MMNRIVKLSFSLVLFLCGTLLFSAAPKVYFQEIREQAKKVKRNSPEDFALGKKLMKEIKALAATKKLVDGKRHFYTEPVMYRSARLYYTYKKWFDHNLFDSRDMYDGTATEFQRKSILASIDMIRDAGFDGFSPLQGSAKAPEVYSRIAAKEKRPDKSKVIPVLWFRYNTRRNMTQLKRTAAGPTWKINGKMIAPSYYADALSPEKAAATLKEIKKHTGIDLAYIHGVGSMRNTGGDPYHNYINTGDVSAVMILKIFDQATKYLEIGEGIQFRNRLHNRDGKLFVEFYDELTLPLYAAVCAQERFNGKKYLGLSVQAAYGYYLGSQPLDRWGTKTLRSYLELCNKHKVDFIHGIEWDETNEDTYLQPTVCKPMACSRITRYYSNMMKGLPPVAFEGDDLSLPNLIVSMPRQYILGAPFEVELLHVPDTVENIPYTVKVELFDQNSKRLYTSQVYKFNASKLTDHTIILPADAVAPARAVYPQLTIEYKGKKRIIDSGLPASVIRATASRDYSWLSTPLRNLMFPERSKVKFTNAGFLAEPMVRKVSVDVDLSFPGRELNSVETVQNSMDNFAYDPQNEFLQNDPSRKLFKLSALSMNTSKIKADINIALTDAPGAIRFVPLKHKRNSSLIVASKKYQPLPWDKPLSRSVGFSRFIGTDIFSVPQKELTNAVLTINGIRTSGPDKGKKFFWSVPLRELGQYGMKMKTFEDGIHYGIETLFKPELLPLPLNQQSAKFKADIANDLPEGVLMLRAVSKDGRVWWSKPFAPQPDSGKKCRISVYDSQRKAYDIAVDSGRIPHLVYKFDPAAGQDALTTDGGREFYGGLGSLISIPTGFEGASHSQNAINLSASLPQLIRKGKPCRSRPSWEKLPDGKWALRFAPGMGQFAAFPPTTVPQRNGFTIKIQVKFDSAADQYIFGQCGPRYLTGHQLRLENGKFVADYKNRRPHDLKSRAAQIDTHKTSLSPVPGKWNDISLSYDGRKITVTVNGKSESFAQTGISQWNSIFTFGGTDPNNRKELKCFAGLLRKLEIIHHP